ncbi:MAG: type II toxin-antitoxin system RelE/ParE family toxin [Chloroflexi bacterium]|nr:type II toxin-antitoxin system RelE/ParE family toxin [Chloroflexota bacterium]
MATLRWLPPALDDIERLIDFLHDKNSAAASRAAAAILDGAESLLTLPRRGRPLPDTTGRRELVVPFAGGAYVLHYMLDDDETIVILRVWHSREDRA